MKSQVADILEQDSMKSVPVDIQIDVLFEMMHKVMESGTIEARIVKYKLQKHIKSRNIFERVHALEMIITDGKGLNIIPDESNIQDVLDCINSYMGETLAKNYVKNRIEREVEKYLVEKQDKYIDELRLSIIKKQKGPENAKTLKKYGELEVLDGKKLSKSVQQLLRPDSFNEIVGQERAIKSILSKIASPYPQHIILYGPPGVGKTTAARLALKEAVKLRHTPFKKDAKFVEVDGTTLKIGRASCRERV